MTDSSIPSDSEDRPRPKLSLRKPKSRPEESKDSPRASTPESKPAKKLSLKNPHAGRPKEDSNPQAAGKTEPNSYHPEHRDSAKLPPSSPEQEPPRQDHDLPPPSPDSNIEKKDLEEGAPPAPKMALKLKGMDSGPPKPEAGSESPPIKSGFSPQEPEPSASPDQKDGVIRKRSAAPNPESIFDLPFNLPESVADDPPPLPQIKRPVKPKTVTFDDLEPVTTSKAPPPRDAPVIKKKRISSTVGKVFTVILAVVFVGLLLAYVALIFRGDDEGAYISEDMVPAEMPENLIAPSADPRAPRSSDPATSSEPTTPAAEPSGAPPAATTRPEPDPDLAFIVDNLNISIARPSTSNPVVIIDGVSYTTGDVIDSRSGLRFIGFSSNLREAIFEDERGARYFRYY